MSPQFFKQQIDRLSSHFGNQHFKVEKVKLIWSEVSDLPDKSFKIIADNFIGNLNVDWPPKVDDFRLSAGTQRKIIFQQETERAAGNVRNISAAEDPSGSMDRFLKKVNAECLMDAIRKTGGACG